METPNLSGLDSLTDIGFRGGVDMRPTLLRVLTDLYVQKLTHTPDEERHYTELAIRLLDAVDVPTRAAVAARLTRHLSPPARVIQFLAGDLPAVAAALELPPVARPPVAADSPPQSLPVSPIAEDAAPDHALDQNGEDTLRENTEAAVAPDSIDSDVANELNELFFAANASERRLILRNLDIVASVPAEQIGIVPDGTVGLRLETAALGGNREVFARHLAHALHITREQAQRITHDELGEPIVVAARILHIPREVLYRILLFINTAVGHSVERVHALADLYDELTPRAADDMVAMWQALHKDKNTATRHQPVVWNDETRARARPTAAPAIRAPATPRRNERRDAS